LDEITQATIDLRAPCPGFPTPESFEARAMPPKDGLRLNHLGRAEQAWPEPGHPYQQRPITAVQSKTRRRTPQGDAELMTEKQVLRFKPAPRLEEVGDAHSERVHDRKHQSNDAMILPHDANRRRIKFSERTGKRRAGRGCDDQGRTADRGSFAGPRAEPSHETLPNIPVHNFLMWQSGSLNGAVIAVLIHYSHIYHTIVTNLEAEFTEGY
jgi:hypothetical protein